MKNGYLFLLMLVAALILLPGCAQVLAATPNEDGAIEVVLSDYSFQPDTIRVKAGQAVTILLRNEGDKIHEFMIGRDARVEGNFTEGFAVDFFAGITPEVTGPGMVMGRPDMEMGGMDMGAEGTAMPMAEPTEEAPMNMGTDSEDMDMAQPTGEASMNMNMDMDAENTAMSMPEPTEDASTSREAGGENMDMPMNEDTDHADEDEHAELAQGEFGALQMPEMDAHAGFMVMIDPTVIASGEVTAITFTVPEDNVGTWTFGCFQERGQHFDDGMRGTFIVEGA
ncbi:MAG: cupredoxin domain-containing protein [Anaerolineae bacterium]|nr:cupredoxin domain-containing protein [Anaerolineae bacterium]